jgi:hypothetical protein
MAVSDLFNYGAPRCNQRAQSKLYPGSDLTRPQPKTEYESVGYLARYAQQQAGQQKAGTKGNYIDLMRETHKVKI